MTDASAIWMGAATIVAVFLGPVLAVLTALHLEKRRAEKTRKWEIFRILMRTRRLSLSWDHVGALNLVEVEFVNHAAVISAWKKYLTKLGEELPPMEDSGRFHQSLQQREALLTELIHEIATVLGIKIPQLDILAGNYIPQRWNDDDWEQRLMRRGLINVLHGKASIRVRQAEQEQHPYPLPPGIK